MERSTEAGSVSSPIGRPQKVDCSGSGAVMRKSMFSESQIVGILKDAERVVPVSPSPDLLRKYGVCTGNVLQVAGHVR